jgi:membrane fusion protein, multidrug efflux system
MSDQAPSANAAAQAGAAKRNRLLTYLAAGVVGAGVLYGAYYVLVGSHFVETDNAYVGAETAQVNALSAGPVKRVLVSETQIVKAGDVLLELDNSDATIALEQAEAALGLAKRKVAGYFAADRAYAGQQASAQAQIAAAKSDYDRARIELQRRQALAETGAVSKDELTQTQNAFARADAELKSAVAAVEVAKGTQDTNQALISGLSIDNNPEVLSAQAKYEAAKLNLERTIVRAPMDGVVAKKAVQVGQQVQIGTPLMAVVPVGQVYVDANFKEVQLKKVKPGQEVELTSDLYGKSVKFRGKVVGISGGTGSAFSLIPAQNASGNWIKVVQRLPVRVAVAPEDLKSHPLRVGLSMAVKIDTSK